jgi:phosphoglycerate kinase
MKSIEQLDLAGKRVFIRVDFNVPLRDGRVTDTTRIDAALPTIRHAIEERAIVILASHLGRPKGKENPSLSLAPVASILEEKLDLPVRTAPDCIGNETSRLVAALKEGQVLLLENLRFHAEEERNDEGFAHALASLADVYVNDAFGTAHRAHASTVGMVPFVAEKAAGFLLQRECEYLGRILTNPDRPFVAILGGAKVSDKIQVISTLLEKVDSLLVGGAMAYTFLRAQGKPTGESLVEEEQLSRAESLLQQAKKRGVDLLLPVDHVVAAEPKEGASVSTVVEIPDGQMGLDIGPETIQAFTERISKAGTVFWNGPLGMFEVKPFAAGSMAIARALAKSQAVTVVGGGDSVAAVTRSGCADSITHISTGGGASLEFLEGKTLPGLAALEDS